jgi:putative MATE family efflux protein
MENESEQELGTKSIPQLIIRQSVPAALGILFMTVNMLIDTVFMGRWIGPLAIAALSVVMPAVFFIGSVGFAIGVGGSSVISRALGDGNKEKAFSAFAHQILFTAVITLALAAAGLIFSEQILSVLGAKGKILEPAKIFYVPILIAAPLQAFLGMGTSVMRAENKARFSMATIVISGVANLVLDFVFIKLLDWGVFGAALATALSFASAFLFMLWFFVFKSSFKPKINSFLPDWKLSKEIAALSLSTFSRQGVITILSILLNSVLFRHGGENAVTVYGIASRMLMFALFPVNGITEGFLPVAGYNFGAKKFQRVRESVAVSVKYAAFLAVLIYAAILIFAEPIVALFTKDQNVLADAPNALRWIFAASPVIALQLIGAAYFQAAGNAKKSLLLTLSKQGFFLIPLILILPQFFGIFGIWVAFPVADILATALTAFFLKREMNQLKN